MSQEKPLPFQIFHLNDEDSGQTLGAAIKKRMGQWSWGQTREAILKRRVQVNGNLCLDQARKVTEKDVVKLWRESLPKPVQPSHVKIVYADDFIVVVEKPPGITSTRHFEERLLKEKRKQLQPTLEELLPLSLEAHFQSRATPERVSQEGRNAARQTKGRLSAQDEQRQRLMRLKKFAVIAVHRLDRDTSGLMVFARTPSIAQMLGVMFRKHDVIRRYHAVVHGHPKAQTFDSVLVRDRGDGKRGTMPADRTEDPSAQRAITRIRPIETIGAYSMVECELETGRTHQIRIHLSEAGHMLCGESIYNRTDSGLSVEDRSDAPRQALHSATLELKHPMTDDPLAFRMPWPADLFKWLKELRNRAEQK
jgi:23S rRNA pseudouridine1911/1915/1917 synthase